MSSVLLKYDLSAVHKTKEWIQLCYFVSERLGEQWHDSNFIWKNGFYWLWFYQL